MVLKMHGALSASALGKQIGTTGEAVRQQLQKLADEGLVQSESRPSGVGRPTQLWMLAPGSGARFPDTHAALTVKLLDGIRETLGEAALDTIIRARELETAKAYEAAMEGASSLEDRVERLTAIRTDEGYMADWERLEDGTLQLRENHCPICAAAAACQGFCRAELQAFKSALGPQAEVQRTEHVLDGGRRCTYRITPKPD